MKNKGLKKEFRELGTLETRINVVKDNIKNPDDYDLDLVYKEIVKIACLLDHLSDHEYGLILQRLERARRVNKDNLLTACVNYVTSLFNLTRDYLSLKLLDNLLAA